MTIKPDAPAERMRLAAAPRHRDVHAAAEARGPKPATEATEDPTAAQVAAVFETAAASAIPSASEAGKSTRASVGHDPKTGRFLVGHRESAGPRAKKVSRIPPDLKTIAKLMADGFIEVDNELPAVVYAEALVRGMKEGGSAGAAYLRLFAEAGGLIGKGMEKDRGGRGGFQVIVMDKPRDPLADPNAPPGPLRLLGQIAGPNGEIVDAKTGEIVGGTENA